MKYILQCDGGGLKGVIPAVVLENFEAVMKKPCCEIFDLITGTSTGAIIGGSLASGAASAKIIREMYTEYGKDMFKPRTFIPIIGTLFGAKYDRDRIIPYLKRFTNNIRLKDVKTKYMLTAFNNCSERTHFIYSTDAFENDYPLWEVISWSALSAVAYFGNIKVPGFMWDDYLPDGTRIANKMGAVFNDGGQGCNNCTLDKVVKYAIKNWPGEKVTILSLGCGSYAEHPDYTKAAKEGLIGSVVDYLSQARNESTIIQVLDAKYMTTKNIGVVRIDCNIPKALDMLDGVKYISAYQDIGNQIKNCVPFELFKQ